MTNTVRECSCSLRFDGVLSLELFGFELLCSLDSELRFFVFFCIPLSHPDVFEGCSFISLHLTQFLSFVGCTRCDGFNDFVDSYRLVIYFIAVGLYTVSYFSTMTRSFMVYVNGRSLSSNSL